MFGPLIIISICAHSKNIFMVGAVTSFLSLIVFLPFTFFFDKSVVLAIILLVIYNVINSGTLVVYTGEMGFNMRSQINTGSYVAIVNAVAAIMAGVIPPITGGIIDASDSYFPVFLIALIISAISACVFFALALIKLFMNKNKIKQQ